MITIKFDLGSLIIRCTDDEIAPIESLVTKDNRLNDTYRADSFLYSEIILTLFYQKIPYKDLAKDFLPLNLDLETNFNAMEHQQEALDAWITCGKRGVIEMPTGSGKSFLAVLAINCVQRPTLIVAPTIDLMQQWATQLEKFFHCEIGMLGGGSKEVRDLTVSTYDSAVIMMEFIGNKFGFVIFDECHHLPGPTNRLAASMCIAPYRMALTATLEREDGEEAILDELIGDVVHRVEIESLRGDILAEYATKTVFVSLEEDELKEYELNRKIYTDFLRRHGITFSQRNDWSQFIIMCSRALDGQKVMNAYQTQKKIARSGRSKTKKIWDIICEHRNEQILIFTAENEAAYTIGTEFCLPVITHQTKPLERKEFLDKFRNGEYPILVTSKVLNEGVDVPQASVGIIVSGTGSIREHVQRLGRILRRAKDKQAVLYELISKNTSEERVSEKRRQHKAYK